MFDNTNFAEQVCQYAEVCETAANMSRLVWQISDDRRVRDQAKESFEKYSGELNAVLFYADNVPWLDDASRNMVSELQKKIQSRRQMFTEYLRKLKCEPPKRHNCQSAGSTGGSGSSDGSGGNLDTQPGI